MRLTPTAQRWSRLLAELDQSNLTAAVFARQRGINASTLTWWRRKLGRPSHPGGFVPVALPVVQAAPASQAPLRIELPGSDLAVVVPLGTDLGWLRAVVVALS